MSDMHIRLREIVAKRYGGSVNAFARAVGISTAAAQAWVAGQTSPNVATIEKICALESVTSDWLIFGAAGKKAPDRDRPAKSRYPEVEDFISRNDMEPDEVDYMRALRFSKHVRLSDNDLILLLSSYRSASRRS